MELVESTQSVELLTTDPNATAFPDMKATLMLNADIMFHLLLRQNTSLQIHAIHLLAELMLSAKKEMAQVRVLAFPSILEILIQDVNQNVLLTMTVAEIKPVQIINA